MGHSQQTEDSSCTGKAWRQRHLTPAEQRHLELALEAGDEPLIRYVGRKGFGMAAWEKCLARMEAAGLVEKFDDRPASFRVTEVGRLTLARQTWADAGAGSGLQRSSQGVQAGQPKHNQATGQTP